MKTSDLIISLGGDASGLRNELAKTSQQLKGLGLSGISVGNMIKKGLFIAVSGLGVFSANIGLGIKKFLESERVAGQLDIQLKRLGVDVQKYRNEIEKTATKWASMTAFDDESIKSALRMFLMMGLQINDAVKALPVAMDFAVGTGYDLLSSANLVGRAFAGNTMMLNRMGIQISKNAKGMQAVNEIAKRFSIKTAGMSAIDAAKFFPIQRIKNEINNIYEEIGRAAAPIILPFLDNLRKGLSVIPDLIKNLGLTETINMALVGGAKTAYEGIKAVFDELIFGELGEGLSNVLIANAAAFISKLLEGILEFGLVLRKELDKASSILSGWIEKKLLSPNIEKRYKKIEEEYNKEIALGAGADKRKIQQLKIEMKAIKDVYDVGAGDIIPKRKEKFYEIEKTETAKIHSYIRGLAKSNISDYIQKRIVSPFEETGLLSIQKGAGAISSRIKESARENIISPFTAEKRAREERERIEEENLKKIEFQKFYENLINQTKKDIQYRENLLNIQRKAYLKQVQLNNAINF